MKLEYIILGVFGIAILYVVVVYIFNSIKMKNKNKPKNEEKPKTTSVVTQTKPTTKPSGENGKVEVKSEILTEKPVEKAIKETNLDYQINEAFEKINAEREEYLRHTQKVGRIGRLKVDRSEFNPELKATKYMKRNVLKSETAEIGHEGPSKKASTEDKKDLNVQTDATAQTIADEINNMSPAAKAILINDILNKKYD